MESEKFLGMYRAKVTGNKDPNKYGRIAVWIPKIMPELTNEHDSLLARPANNPIGGRNMEGDTEHHYMGSSYIPKKGSWVWVFFEAGDVNSPYYTTGVDLENTQVLPECRVGTDYEDKWVVFKSHDGRTIVISDDPADSRVEITGKKRKMTAMATAEPPTGDEASVYEIPGNQTVILLDERPDKEKILIKSHKGDFINFNILDQTLDCSFTGDVTIQTGGTLTLTAAKDVVITSTKGSITEQAGLTHSRISGGDMFDYSGANHHTKVTDNINRDGAMIKDQGGAATSATSKTPKTPTGERDS